MNFCKDCANWGVWTPNVCDGACDDVKEVQNGLSTEFRIQPQNGFGLWLTADDDQGLNGALVTGPEFGCNKFKQKK